MSQVRVALVHDCEVVTRGLAGKLRSGQNRIQAIELDLNKQVSEPVGNNILYDTVAVTRGDRGGGERVHLGREGNTAPVVGGDWPDRARSEHPEPALGRSLFAGA